MDQAKAEALNKQLLSLSVCMHNDLVNLPSKPNSQYSRTGDLVIEQPGELTQLQQLQVSKAKGQDNMQCSSKGKLKRRVC